MCGYGKLREPIARPIIQVLMAIEERKLEIEAKKRERHERQRSIRGSISRRRQIKS